MKNRNVLLTILLAGLLARLYHIDFPVAGFQAWRQADTAAMARNFFENGFRFLYPQIDWGGASAGYVETEFPLYSFVVALLHGLFGFNDLWGRLVSVLCSLGTITMLYLLVRREVSEPVALWSAGLYAVLPLNIFYARAFMPESAMLMFSAAGVAAFAWWMDRDSRAGLVLSAALIALAALLKIVALYLAIPLFFLAWRKYGAALFRRWRLYAFALLVLLPVGAWYVHAHAIFREYGHTFGIWMFGTNKWGIFDILFTAKWYNDIFFKSIAERHLTYAGFIPFLAGAWVFRSDPRYRLFLWWLAGVTFYFLLVASGNQIHEYYQLPFTLPAVVFVGGVLDRFLSGGKLRNALRNRRWGTLGLAICLIALPVLSFLRVANYMRGERLDSSLFHLAAAAGQVTARGDLVVAIDEGDPVVLYRCDRKGWHGFPDTVTPELLRAFAEQGARWLVAEKGKFNDETRLRRLEEIRGAFPAARDADDHIILDLGPQDRSRPGATPSAAVR